MINELIEKEIEKLGKHTFFNDQCGQVEARCICHNKSKRDLTKFFAQTIAKEVAMKFRKEFCNTTGTVNSLNIKLLANLIIYEVSK